VQTIGADPAVHDLTRVLRIPGTLNLKYEPARPVHWLEYDLGCEYTIQALTAHLPPIHEAEPKFKDDNLRRSANIETFNRDTDIGDLLQRYGYAWRGTRRMISPHSGSKRDGVCIDSESNRAFVHTGGDPLCDGYWKRPFDVVKILECGGDFQRALEAIRQ
jgi:hypothetical protein